MSTFVQIKLQRKVVCLSAQLTAFNELQNDLIFSRAYTHKTTLVHDIAHCGWQVLTKLLWCKLCITQEVVTYEHHAKYYQQHKSRKCTMATVRHYSLVLDDVCLFAQNILVQPWFLQRWCMVIALANYWVSKIIFVQKTSQLVTSRAQGQTTILCSKKDSLS